MNVERKEVQHGSRSPRDYGLTGKKGLTERIHQKRGSENED